MGLSFIIGVIGLGLSAIGLVTQQISDKKARKQQKRQFEESNRLRREAEARTKRLADLRALRERRAAAREAQRRRAEITSVATDRGAAGSSSVVGAQGSIRTQLASNLSFLDQSVALNTQAMTLFGQAQEAQNRPIFRSTLGSSLASFGGTVFEGSEKIAKGIRQIRRGAA